MVEANVLVTSWAKCTQLVQDTILQDQFKFHIPLYGAAPYMYPSSYSFIRKTNP